jgi:hypothetical protein
MDNYDRDNEHESSALARLESSKDFPAVRAIVEHLRKRDPKTVPAKELAYVVDRQKRQVYGLLKLARRWLAMTTGEFIPNLRNVGYRITHQPRAALFESIKSGNRADGHLGQEIITFRRVNRDALTSSDDVELYLVQQARIRLGEARLKLSEDAAPAMRRLRANAALAAVAARDAETPWKEIGLDNPDEDKAN